MFTGSMSKWMATAAAETESKTMGDTQVSLAYNSGTRCLYAYFESSGIIYEIRAQYGYSEAALEAVPDSLLA